MVSLGVLSIMGVSVSHGPGLGPGLGRAVIATGWGVGWWWPDWARCWGGSAICDQPTGEGGGSAGRGGR